MGVGGYDLESVYFCVNICYVFLNFLHKNEWYCAEKFYDLLSESVNNKKDNNFYLTSERYNSLLNEVKEAKSVKAKQTVHYGRLKR